MNSRICVCCGEPIHAERNALSRNPNICASCSSLADGMEDSSLPDAGAVGPRPIAEIAMRDITRAKCDQKDSEPLVQVVSTGG